MSDRIRVGITHGDYNGVSYEIILKALAEPEILEMITPVVFGSSELAASTIRNLGLEGVHFTTVKSAADAIEGRINVVDVCSEYPEPTPGVASDKAGRAALDALESSAGALERNDIDVLVTAPIDKNSIHSDSFSFTGHTEYLHDRFGGDGERALMVLFNDMMRVALVTTHLPVARVSEAITRERVGEAISDFDATLRKDFGCDRPLIAVLGLNPHCGDGGVIGTEETEVIIPAIEEAKEKGVLVFGPFPADGFFAAESYKKFDGVLAMYHDQGLAPFKALAGASGVNFTAGLSIVRTSPDHGTAYNLAGKNIANPLSMREAIFRAVDIYRKRADYLDYSSNPLKVHRDRPEGHKSRRPGDIPARREKSLRTKDYMPEGPEPSRKDTPPYGEENSEG